MNKSKATRIADVCRVAKPGNTWFDRLTPEQQEFCLAVRKHVHEKGKPHTPVARNLIAELKLSVAAQTVAKWFREGR